MVAVQHHLQSYARFADIPLSPPYPSIREIQDVVCEAFEVRRVDLMSTRRKKRLVVPRQAAMWLSRWLTPCSYPAIARDFADRDHTTIIYGVSRTQQRMDDDPAFEARVLALARVIGEGDLVPMGVDETKGAEEGP